jgi:hypothetical protein
MSETRKRHSAPLPTKQAAGSSLAQAGPRRRRDWNEILEPMAKAARESERLDAEDFAIRINKKD